MKKFLMVLILMIIFMPNVYGKYIISSNSYITINNRKPIYTIKFNSNSGIGIMDDITLSYGERINLPLNCFIKDRYDFIGWNDSYGNYYSDGEMIENLSTVENDIVNLYANWETYYIYFQLPPDWGSEIVSVYLFNDINQIYNATYPGEPAILVDSDKRIFAYRVNKKNASKYTHVLFSDAVGRDRNATKQTIDIPFSLNDLGKIFVPKLYNIPNKIRIFYSGDKYMGPKIYLWKRIGNNDQSDMNWNNRPYMGHKISGYGYDYIIDTLKYNMFILSYQQLQTDDIKVPLYQDLTYRITSSNSHGVSRYYYDGIWYDYNIWNESQYNYWKNDDYIKFLSVPRNYY